MVAIAIALALLGEDGLVRLRWDAPAECPERQVIVDRVAAHLTGAAATLGPVAVDAEVRARQGRFVLELAIDSSAGSGRRTLRGRDCEALARVAVLVIAIAIDPSLADRQAVVQPTRRELAGPALAVVVGDATTPAGLAATGDRTAGGAGPRTTPLPAPKARSRSRRRPGTSPVALRVDGGGEAGALPGVGAGLGVALSYVWPRARLELHGTWLAPRLEPVRDADTEGAARLQLGAVGLRGCARIVRRRLEVPLCGGAELGALEYRSRGYRPQELRRLPWAALLLGPRLAFWPLPALGLHLDIALAVHLTRPTIRATSPMLDVHRPYPVGVRFTGGIELRF